MWSRRGRVVFPKGSLVIEQIHYNLLQGDAPVRAKLTLVTVPASTPLKPLHLNLLPAPRTSRVRPE